MQIRIWKPESDENGQSWKKIKMLTFDFKKSNFDHLLYLNVILISEKWIRIHTWEVKISQRRQNGKK